MAAARPRPGTSGARASLPIHKCTRCMPPAAGSRQISRKGNNSCSLSRAPSRRPKCEKGACQTQQTECFHSRAVRRRSHYSPGGKASPRRRCTSPRTPSLLGHRGTAELSTGGGRSPSHPQPRSRFPASPQQRAPQLPSHDMLTLASVACTDQKVEAAFFYTILWNKRKESAHSVIK